MKNHFSLIFNLHLRIIKNSIISAHPLKIVSFIFVIVCFLGVAYYSFYRLFNYLCSAEIIGVAIMDKILEMAFFVFLIMLLASNIITSLATFYRDRELSLLFCLPIRPTSIYLAKLFENCLYASWATMVVALPLIAAYGICMKISLWYYPMSIMGVFVYLFIPAAIASIIVFILKSFLPRLCSRDIIILALLFIFGLTLLYIKVGNPTLLKIFETENEQELLKVVANLSTVGGSYVPSTWISNIFKGMKVNSNQVVFYFGLLLCVSASLVIIAYNTARFLYVKTYCDTIETRCKKGINSPLSRYQHSPSRTFMYKDLLTFIREPIQWVQIAIFIILLIVYIFSLRNTPIYFAFPLWRTIVSFANFAYICFVLATLGVRFIYPAISLEHDGIWLIGSSPFSFKRVVIIKYLFNLILAIIIIEGLLILSNIFIKTDPQMHYIMPIIALFVAASLVSINLGFGGRFPQFQERNPSKIAAGPGGIIAALASIGYVGITGIILATPAYNYLSSRYLNQPLNIRLILFALLMFITLNIFTIIFPMHQCLRSLQLRDF